MIKDIILHVSRSYNPYVQSNEIWGAGQTFAGELDNDFNARKFIKFDNNNDWNTINLDGNNVIAIKSNGTLWQWGPNSQGQLGLNDTITRSSPVQVGTLNTWTSASTMANTSIALRNDGTLWGWGFNTSGELGLGDQINRSSPVQIGASTWNTIFATSNPGYTIALDSNNNIWGWGSTLNVDGVYGNGERPGAFGQIDGGSLDWNDVSPSNSYTIAVGSDGRLWAWGFNTNGQLGLNDSVLRSSAVQIGTLSTWVSASANRNNYVMAIQNNGTLWAWGVNTNGRLGLNDTVTRSSPVQVGTDANWLSVTTPGTSVLAIKTDGTLWSWGGAASIGSYAGILAANAYELKQIDNLTTWVSASYNASSVVAIKTDGTLWAWGSNSSGVLGLNDTITRSSPVQVGTDTNWSNAFLPALGNFCIALKTDGTLWSWGSNSLGQLGQNISTTVSRSSPVQVGTRTWNDISGTNLAVLAVRSDNTLWAWGNNQLGILGVNLATSTQYLSPVQVGTDTNWSTVSTARQHHCLALKTDGTLWSWGANTDGQLGLNNTTNRSSPVQVGTRTWNDARAGQFGSRAIRSDGTIWSWGNNGEGQLGDGTKITRSSPVQVGTDTNWLRLGILESASEYGPSYAIKTDKSLWAWGRVALKDNIDTGTTSGYLSPVQIGIGISWESVVHPGRDYTTFAISSDNKLYAGPGIEPNISFLRSTQRSSPVQIGTETNWASIHGHGSVASAIKTDGTLWGWGNALNGYPIINNSFAVIDSPVQINSDVWKKFRIGTQYVIGIKNDDTLWTWGVDTFGSLGLGINGLVRSSPVQIGNLLWKEIGTSDGTYNTFAIRNDGTLWGWGRNNAYQLGLADIISRSSPVQIGGDTDWYSVYGSDTHTAAIKNRLTKELHTTGVANTYTAAHRVINGWDAVRRSPILLSQGNPWSKFSSRGVSLAIKNDGTLWAWGQNTNGQLGLGNTINRSSPVQVGTRTDWKDVFTDGSTTFAILNDDTLWVWGSNSNGQLGLNLSGNRSSPVQLGTLTWNDVKSNGNGSIFAIRSDNTLWSWGFNNNGELGLNDSNLYRSSPVQVGTETNWSRFGSYKNVNTTFFALKNDNSVYVLNGSNTDKSVAGISFLKSSPVQVTSTRDWKSISAGTSFTIAISNSGSIWVWGSNNGGVIGDSVSTSGGQQESPVQIGTLTTWVSGSGGDSYAAAIQNDGTLWTWGVNTSGQLGLGNTITRSSPVQVGTLTWSSVSTGRSHTMAIRSDGTMWGWGTAAGNRIDTNPSANRSSPIQIGNALKSNWSQVSAGAIHNMAIDADGFLFGWGTNTSGELGINSATTTGNPTQVGTETWKDVSAGSQMTVAVRNDGTLWAWGLNSFGRLGIERNRSLPNYVIRPKLFDDVRAGYQSVIAKSTDGTIWSWGANTTYGQLGLGDVVNRSSPVQIGTRTWNKISNGGFHAMAISSGSLWIWGDNSNSGLGLLEYGLQYLSGSNTWTDVKTGEDSIILKDTNNTLWSLGGNLYGQLGLSDTNRRISPVSIGTKMWNSYSVGQRYALAIDTGGKLWGWGSNEAAELGLLKNRSLPQYVNISQTWIDARAGQNFIIAKGTDGSLWSWGLNGSGNLGSNDIVTRSSPVQIGTETNWGDFDAGSNHVIAVKTDGTLWAWGNNGTGPLGLNDMDGRSSPVQVGTLSNWSQVSAGLSLSYAIKTDGTLWAWGRGDQGGIGDLNTNRRSSPVQVGTETNWAKLAKSDGSSQSQHIIAIKTDGTLWSWGNNFSGNLGLNDTISRSSPVQVGTRTDWSMAYIGESHTMALLNDKTLYVWGSNLSGALGLNLASTANRSSPVQLGTLTWNSVSTGAQNSMAIRSDGTLWAWGTNSDASLGLGDITVRSSPVQVGTLSTFVSASLGANASILLTNDGYALATGAGANTLPGFDISFMVNKSSPVQIGTDTNWAYSSAGSAHSMAIKTDGTLWAWGENGNGNLGIGNTQFRSSPVQVGTLNNWSKVYIVASTYAIKTDGTLWAWGYDSIGNLGQGVFNVFRSSPVQIGTLTWNSVSDADANATHVLAIRSDGTLWAWGNNNNGQLGLDNTVNRSSPVQVGTKSDWIYATVGYAHSMAVSSNGTLWSWGLNTNHQLGLNDSFTRSSPVQVGTLSTWTSASLDINFSALLQNNGDVYTTGLSTSDYAAFRSNRSSPVQVGTLSNWADMDGGYLHTLAVKTDGTLWSWGRNSEGQLGVGNNVGRSSPVQVGTLNNWSKVSGGYTYSISLKTDGTLWAWGGNTGGQLGLGNTVTRSSPVQVGTLTWNNIADIGGFQVSHTMAIRSDGTLWAWGQNTNGQLGISLTSTDHRSSPVQVGTRTDWIYAAVGDDTSMAIRSDGTLWAWGLNSNAELGLNDAINRSSPVQVGTETNWASVSLGDANSVSLKKNGYVLTTGIYAHGYDILSYNVNRSSPAQIGADNDWVKVHAGHSTFSATGNQVIAQKADGTIWTWGSNTAGNLADGTNITRSSPVQIGNETTWVDFSAQLHFVGIKRY